MTRLGFNRSLFDGNTCHPSPTGIGFNYRLCGTITCLITMTSVGANIHGCCISTSSISPTGITSTVGVAIVIGTACSNLQTSTIFTITATSYAITSISRSVGGKGYSTLIRIGLLAFSCLYMLYHRSNIDHSKREEERTFSKVNLHDEKCNDLLLG